MIDTTILSLIGVETSLIEKYEFLGEDNNEIILSIKLASSEKDTCPKCGSSLRKIKDYTYKRYKYYGLVTKTITVIFAQKRFICDCGKTKMQYNPFIKRNSGYKVKKHLPVIQLQKYGIFMSVTTLLVIKLLQMRRLLFNTVVYRCLYVIGLCARVFIGKAFWV